MTIVEISTGKVEGRERDGILTFSNIPYAAPPVGERRFRPPAPAEPWAGTRDATSYGPIAPQAPSSFHQAFGTQPPAASEAECLNLNVWTPGADDAKRPVMVWLHGGAFLFGDGRTPWYRGTNLARRDVVVVTLNYRLAALGYTHLADIGGEDWEGSGNAGLLDQIAALRWVQENIAGFGGDPAKVTVFGESAGAMSIGAMLGLPAARGLFHRAILQSGATEHVHDAAYANEMSGELLHALGIDTTRLSALQDVPLEALLDAQAEILANRWGSAGVRIPWQPVVDGTIIPRQPLDTIRAGGAADVALIAGMTSEEMRLFTTFDPMISEMDDDEIAERAETALGEHVDPRELVEAYRRHLGGSPTKTELWTAILTDRVFAVPALEMLSAQHAHQPHVHAFEFAFRSTAWGGALGASHAMDVPFGFDNVEMKGVEFFTGERTDEMRRLSRAMGDAWTSFAHSGVPESPELPAWSTWDPQGAATMILDLEPRLAHDPWAFARETWNLLHAAG